MFCLFFSQLCLLEPLQFIHSSLHNWQRRASLVVQFAKEFFRQRLSCRMSSVICSLNCAWPQTNWSPQSLSLKEKRKNVMKWWVLNPCGKVLRKPICYRLFSLKCVGFDYEKLCRHQGGFILELINEFQNVIVGRSTLREFEDGWG